MGATALGGPLYPGNSLWSLGVQMGWFDDMVNLRATRDGNYMHQSNTNMSNEFMPNVLIDQLIHCMIVPSDAKKHFLGDSDLVLLGEFGGNDYYAYFNAGNKPHGNAADEYITNVITYITHFVEVWYGACTPICTLFSNREN